MIIPVTTSYDSLLPVSVVETPAPMYPLKHISETSKHKSGISHTPKITLMSVIMYQCIPVYTYFAGDSSYQAFNLDRLFQTCD